MARITESQLILPTLYLIDKYPDISTSELIEKLTAIFQPTGEDAEINRGRNDTKFSQIVRNIVSHDTLENGHLGFATYARSGRNGHFRITGNGEEHLRENLASLEYLLDSKFQYSDLVSGMAEIQFATEQQRRLLPLKKTN